PLIVEFFRIEMLLGVEDLAHADMAVHRFANDREDFGQHIGAFELAAGEIRAEFLGAGAKLFIGESHDLWLHRVNLLDHAAITLDQPIVSAAKYLGENFSGGTGHGEPREAIAKLS